MKTRTHSNRNSWLILAAALLVLSCGTLSPSPTPPPQAALLFAQSIPTRETQWKSILLKPAFLFLHH